MARQWVRPQCHVVIVQRPHRKIPIVVSFDQFIGYGCPCARIIVCGFAVAIRYLCVRYPVQSLSYFLDFTTKHSSDVECFTKRTFHKITMVDKPTRVGRIIFLRNVCIYTLIPHTHKERSSIQQGMTVGVAGYERTIGSIQLHPVIVRHIPSRIRVPFRIYCESYESTGVCIRVRGVMVGLRHLEYQVRTCIYRRNAPRGPLESKAELPTFVCIYIPQFIFRINRYMGVRIDYIDLSNIMIQDVTFLGNSRCRFRYPPGLITYDYWSDRLCFSRFYA